MGWFNRCCPSSSTGCLIAEDTFTRTQNANTGWVTAGSVTTSGDGVSWSGTGNLAADDGSYASVALAPGERSQDLDLSSFGLSVPSSALITGIEVRYRRYASATGAILGRLHAIPTLYTPTYNQTKYDPTNYMFGGRWEAVETEVTVGGDADSWGLILSPEEVNSSNFKIRIWVSNDSASTRTAYIDIVQIRVHYRTSPIGAGWYVSSGTWNMLNYGSNHCVTCEDTNAYLRFETPHPSSVAEHVVLVNLMHNLNDRYPGQYPDYYKHGDKARIVLCDTLFVEIELGFNEPQQYYTAGCFILRLFNGTTLLQESKPIGCQESGGIFALWAGYSATTGVLWVSFAMEEGRGPTSVYMREDVGTVSGTKVGIGTGDTVNGRIIFSHFGYYKHNYSTVVTNCYEPGDEITQGCTFTKYLFYYYPGDPLTELGCGWEIVAGSWSAIDWGYYSTPGGDDLYTEDANALIRCTQDQSSWNCIEYTDFGYQKLFVYLMWFTKKGDIARFYVDYDDATGDAHWGEITCGGSAGEDSIIKLGKGGTTLETAHLPFGPMEGTAERPAPLQVTLCTFVAEDGEDAVSILVEGFWDYYLPGHNDYTINLVSFTTVYGNKRVAFGTGATVDGRVTFRTGDYGIYGSANANACRDCYPSECPPCPAGDGPQGMIIDISGFVNKYSQYCGNCPDLDASYVVPASGYVSAGGGCTGWKQWLFCEGPPGFGRLTYYLGIWWSIEEEVPGSSWTLSIAIGLRAEGYYPPYPCNVLYKKTFTMSQRCDTLVEETIPYDSGPIFPGGFGSCICDGVTSLTVEVTSY